MMEWKNIIEAIVTLTVPMLTTRNIIPGPIYTFPMVVILTIVAYILYTKRSHSLMAYRTVVIRDNISV